MSCREKKRTSTGTNLNRASALGWPAYDSETRGVPISRVKYHIKLELIAHSSLFLAENGPEGQKYDWRQAASAGKYGA